MSAEGRDGAGQPCDAPHAAPTEGSTCTAKKAAEEVEELGRDLKGTAALLWMTLAGMDTNGDPVAFEDALHQLYRQLGRFSTEAYRLAEMLRAER